MRLQGLFLSTLLLAMPAAADDRQALEYFERHLRLLALAADDVKFTAYYQLYRDASTSQKLAHMDDMLMDISLYWQQQTQTRADDGNAISRLQRVMAVEPKARDYLWVTNRIRYLDWLQRQGDWPALSADIWLEQGDRHPQVSLLAQRLMQLGDLSDNWQGEREFDSELARAVRRFQQRHGLEMDAVVGPKTLYWLNLSPEERATQLAKNFVERHTYLSRIGDRYLLVNIPAYEMKLIDDGMLRLHSRVIVGSRYRQTPVLKSQISNIVINPSWRVPRRLMVRDLKPKILKDGNYVLERGFDAYDVKGNKLDYSLQQWQQMTPSRFPYRLVQRPGEDNALGRYKFHFANDFSVYLHDTPDKHLFAKADRALSSGCIRVERVDALANWVAANLVTDKQTWVSKVNDPRFETQWFALNDVLPIHLVYWTAWMQGPDDAQFRSDIYRKAQAPVSLSAKTQVKPPQ